jgi:hypothetical protein
VPDALAHSVKTPPTATRTASSRLLEAGRLFADDEELEALIDEQAEHLNRLTTELLQMARIDAAELTLRRERVSCSRWWKMSWLAIASNCKASVTGSRKRRNVWKRRFRSVARAGRRFPAETRRR